MKCMFGRKAAKAADVKTAAEKAAEERAARRAKAPKAKRVPVPLTGKKGVHKKRAALGYSIDD